MLGGVARRKKGREGKKEERVTREESRKKRV
jgi:hypothetical protein